MVGAIKDAERNLFSPPPLFALSPRMIVTDEEKRRSMRRVLIDYLDGKAHEAERELLEDLEREGSVLLGGGGGGENPASTKKAGKNARKKAKKKKKQQEKKQQQMQQQEAHNVQQESQLQQSQQQSTQRQATTFQQAHQKASEQNPLNDEQLRYLREHQQQQKQQKQQSPKSGYSEEDRKIIEDALQRNGLSSSAATSTACAEQIYKESCNDSSKKSWPCKDFTADDDVAEEKREDPSGGENDSVPIVHGAEESKECDNACHLEGEDSSEGDEEEKPPPKQPLKHDEEEVQNYAYAWCCDYCKTATFPTFAEAALHEAQCPAFLAQKDEEKELKGMSGGDGGVERVQMDDSCVPTDKAHVREEDDGGGVRKSHHESTSSEAEIMEDDALSEDPSCDQREMLNKVTREEYLDMEIKATTIDEIMPIIDAINLEWAEVGKEEDVDPEKKAQEEGEENAHLSVTRIMDGNDTLKTMNAERQMSTPEKNDLTDTGSSVDKKIKVNLHQAKEASGSNQKLDNGDVKKVTNSKKEIKKTNESNNGRKKNDEKQHNPASSNNGKQKANKKVVVLSSSVSAESSSSASNGKNGAVKSPPTPPLTSAASNHGNRKLNEPQTESEGWKPVESPKKSIPLPKVTKNKTGKSKNTAIAPENIAPITAPRSEKSNATSKTRIKNDGSTALNNEISTPKRKSTKNKVKKEVSAKNGQEGQEATNSLEITDLVNSDNRQNENISTSSNETKEHRSNNIISVDSTTTATATTPSSPSTNNITTKTSSFSEKALAQMMKPLTINYEDRVNETALPSPHPSPNNAAQTSILPPLEHDLVQSASEGPATSSPPPTLPQDLSSGATVEAIPSCLSISSLTSKNEILAAANTFLVAENEAIRNQLAIFKQQSVEALQRVQLKAYIAETARDNAEERASRLEEKLANALAEMAQREVARPEAEAMGTAVYHSYSSSSQQQLMHPMPPPQAMPPAYHFQPQRASSPVSLPISNGMVPLPLSPGNIPNNLLGRPPIFHNLHQNSGSSPFHNSDFQEPPWMMRNESSFGASRESVLSRLRRGDHA